MFCWRNTGVHCYQGLQAANVCKTLCSSVYRHCSIYNRTSELAHPAPPQYMHAQSLCSKWSGFYEVICECSDRHSHRTLVSVCRRGFNWATLPGIIPYLPMTGYFSILCAIQWTSVFIVGTWVSSSVFLVATPMPESSLSCLWFNKRKYEGIPINSKFQFKYCWRPADVLQESSEVSCPDHFCLFWSEPRRNLWHNTSVRNGVQNKITFALFRRAWYKPAEQTVSDFRVLLGTGTRETVVIFLL